MALSCSSFSLSFILSLRIFRESKASYMYFFAFSILRICVWKQTFSPGKDERYRLTFDWHFITLSQSEIRVHWWTHNSKNLTYLGRREFNSTLDQSSQGLATRVHGFSTKTKALAREIPPATQATSRGNKWWRFVCSNLIYSLVKTRVSNYPLKLKNNMSLHLHAKSNRSASTYNCKRSNSFKSKWSGLL